MQNGVKHMRVVFKIEGPYRKGTVHVEVFQVLLKLLTCNLMMFKRVILEVLGRCQCLIK